VGLWVTKHLSDLGPVAFLNQAHDLAQITETDTHWDIGAMVTIETLRLWAVDHMPALADLLRRYASTQVRMAATLGGNIANGSPIGDSPPALIALGATLTLRRGDTRRTIPLQDFFIDYGKQDLQPCEFVQSVQIPKTDHDLRCYKISKRFDQDISALLGCFNIRVDANTVQDAKIAFGGMAGIPKRARAVERALIGHPWTLDTITAAQSAWADDFQPLSDMRASADYRLKTARNLLVRYFHDRAGTPTSVHEVAV
jgi:xanthine dehydrogenase small subunit